MIYLWIYLIGVVIAAVFVFIYEKGMISNGFDFTLYTLLAEIIFIASSWICVIVSLEYLIFKHIADAIKTLDEIIIIKGKRK